MTIKAAYLFILIDFSVIKLFLHYIFFTEYHSFGRQTVSDGTVNLTKSIFYKQIKTLHLDFSPRAAVNADGDQTPLATMVHVYQLKDRKAVDTANYPTLLRNADALLGTGTAALAAG